MIERTSASSVLDEYLVIQSGLGDSHAFSRLVRRWHPRLVRRAYGLTKDRDAARDIAQESWVAIMRGLRSLRDPAAFSPWALRIVANKSRAWIRREQARRRALEGAGAEPPSAPSTPAADTIIMVREGLTRLKPAQREILRLFYFDAMSIREIADALDIPNGTVKSRLYHARVALRVAVEGS